MRAAKLGRIPGGCGLAEGSNHLAEPPSLRVSAGPWFTLLSSPLSLCSVFTPTCPSKSSTLCM